MSTGGVALLDLVPISTSASLAISSPISSSSSYSYSASSLSTNLSPTSTSSNESMRVEAMKQDTNDDMPTTTSESRQNRRAKRRFDQLKAEALTASSIAPASTLPAPPSLSSSSSSSSSPSTSSSFKIRLRRNSRHPNEWMTSSSAESTLSPTVIETAAAVASSSSSAQSVDESSVNSAHSHSRVSSSSRIARASFSTSSASSSSSSAGHLPPSELDVVDLTDDAPPDPRIMQRQLRAYFQDEDDDDDYEDYDEDEDDSGEDDEDDDDDDDDDVDSANADEELINNLYSPVDLSWRSNKRRRRDGDDGVESHPSGSYMDYRSRPEPSFARPLPADWYHQPSPGSHPHSMHHAHRHHHHHHHPHPHSSHHSLHPYGSSPSSSSVWPLHPPYAIDRSQQRFLTPTPSPSPPQSRNEHASHSTQSSSSSSSSQSHSHSHLHQPLSMSSFHSLTSSLRPVLSRTSLLSPATATAAAASVSSSSPTHDATSSSSSSRPSESASSSSTRDRLQGHFHLAGIPVTYRSSSPSRAGLPRLSTSDPHAPEIILDNGDDLGYQLLTSPILPSTPDRDRMPATIFSISQAAWPSPSNQSDEALHRHHGHHHYHRHDHHHSHHHRHHHDHGPRLARGNVPPFSFPASYSQLSRWEIFRSGAPITPAVSLSSFSPSLLDHLCSIERPGLSRAELDRLPTSIITSTMKFVEDDCCVICLDSYEVGQSIRRLPCLHIHHTSCVDQWLKKAKSCPTCRIDVQTQE